MIQIFLSTLYILGNILFLGSCSTSQTSKDASLSSFGQEVSLPQSTDSLRVLKIGDIPVPEGYQRTSCVDGSVGAFLRSLNLSTDNTVYYYNGDKKWSQKLHYAVVDLDVGSRDLQQCADAAMRLRAEYLYSKKEYEKIHFNFLSDNLPRYYTEYAGGDYSYSKFRKYLDYIYSYANTRSLSRELQKVSDVQQVQIGDVFIQTGNPYGHAVTVMDMAENAAGDKLIMISQSFMPAQSIHILRNQHNEKLSPWYSIDFGDELNTPEWTFYPENLKRFKD